MAMSTSMRMKARTTAPRSSRAVAQPRPVASAFRSTVAKAGKTESVSNVADELRRAVAVGVASLLLASPLLQVDAAFAGSALGPAQSRNDQIQADSGTRAAAGTPADNFLEAAQDKTEDLQKAAGRFGGQVDSQLNMAAGETKNKAFGESIPQPNGAADQIKSTLDKDAAAKRPGGRAEQAAKARNAEAKEKIKGAPAAIKKDIKQAGGNVFDGLLSFFK